MFNFVYKNIDFAHKLDKASSPTEEYFKHIHSFCEILVFVKGNVEYTVESETRRLSEGDIVFVYPGKYHFATVDSSYAYERYVFKFPFDLLPSYLRQRVKSKYWISTNCKKHLSAIRQFDDYVNEYNQEELYSLFLCEATKLIIQLCHEDKEKQQINNEFISRITDYIESNICSQITLQTLADEFHYSKSFIAIEFKKYMKIPIMLYVRQKKIVRAHLMILSGVPKTQAANAVGFETYSTFYRCYKQYASNSELHEP